MNDLVDQLAVAACAGPFEDPGPTPTTPTTSASTLF
jgi:hypothetical protein